MSQAYSNTTLGGSALEGRIAAAFSDGVTSADVISLIAEAESAALASGKSADHARERALDPTLTASAVVEARRHMEDAAFRRERLQTAVSRLRERLKEARTQEENQRRLIAYEKARAERDQLAAELKAVYPQFEEQLRYLLPRIVENDRQIEFINARAMPTGMERLLGAELIARGLEGWRVKSSDVVRITRELCLPAFKHDPHASYAWQDR
jgi:hypothetical protein